MCDTWLFIYLFRFNVTVLLLLIGHIVTTLLFISLTSRLSQPSSSRHEYCNFTCLSPDMPDFHVACLRVFILPPWIPFQVQPPAFYTLVAEFEARGFESTPTSESGYRTRVLWESSILWRHECGFNTALNALSYRGSLILLGYKTISYIKGVISKYLLSVCLTLSCFKASFEPIIRTILGYKG